MIEYSDASRLMSRSKMEVMLLAAIRERYPETASRDVDLILEGFPNDVPQLDIAAHSWRLVLCIADRDKLDRATAQHLQEFFAALSFSDRLCARLREHNVEFQVEVNVSAYLLLSALARLAVTSPQLSYEDLHLTADDLRRNHIPRWSVPRSPLAALVADLEQAIGLPSRR